MRKLNIKIFFLTTLFVVLFSQSYTPARAQLDIDLGVPSGEPIFTVENMLPGDEETRSITATNNTTADVELFVKCEEIEEIKNFSEILDFVIIKDASEIYPGSMGSKTVEDFCSEASSSFSLGAVAASSTAVYSFSASFPSSAGNEYQLAKYVFDLLFSFEGNKEPSIVINEVYYQVDMEHGLDSLNDRSKIHAEISGNAEGSVNIIDLRIRNTCIVLQNNTANVSNNISSNANSGGNRSIVFSSSSNSSVSVINFFNFNFAYGSCSGIKTGINDEWVELYNPTDQSVSLKNWSLKDNSGIARVIHSNTTIGPGEFVLIAKDSDTWQKWDEPMGIKKINLGQQFGDGLDNTGDRLELLDADGVVQDYTAWGDDSVIWDPAVLLVNIGSSMERLTAGFDNDLATDWQEQAPPSPGI